MASWWKVTGGAFVEHRGLRIAGQLYQGFPILLWDSMASCVEVNQFFAPTIGDIGKQAGINVNAYMLTHTSESSTATPVWD